MGRETWALAWFNEDKAQLHIIRDKIPLLEKQGFKITLKKIEDVVMNPDHKDEVTDAPKIIVSKEYDEKHVLRVVYKIEGGIIKTITVYPAEKGRYY